MRDAESCCNLVGILDVPTIVPRVVEAMVWESRAHVDARAHVAHVTVYLAELLSPTVSCGASVLLLHRVLPRLVEQPQLSECQKGVLGPHPSIAVGDSRGEGRSEDAATIGIVTPDDWHLDKPSLLERFDER